MFITELFGSEVNIRRFDVVKETCSHFLQESEGLPIYKTLPYSTGDIKRIKVRHKKESSLLGEAFSEAFDPKLTQRGVYVSGVKPEQSLTEEAYYILPVDGYKFIYSKDVQNSTDEYKQIVESLFAQLSDDNAFEVVSDMLKFTYTNKNLCEGIQTNAEIILYSIPKYYAIRSSLLEYEELYQYCIK